VNAQLKPVELAAERPVYNNENVAFADYWIRDNHEALLAWWNAGEHYEGEFLSFCLAQWDYAESRRHELANTLRIG
jgi:hypothetical protein